MGKIANFTDRLPNGLCAKTLQRQGILSAWTDLENTGEGVTLSRKTPSKHSAWEFPADQRSLNF